MSRRGNPALIGAFVLGGLAIALVALFLLTERSWFTDRPRHVMFFEGSVHGLSIGAPVMFRGVKIGVVTDITLNTGDQVTDFYIPVYAELDPERLRALTHTQPGELERLTKERNVAGSWQMVRSIQPGALERLTMEHLIALGLRAQLQLQSLLTGQLFIQLDFKPDKPAVLRMARNGAREIPTIPSPTQEILRQVEDFPLEKTLADLGAALSGIKRLTESTELATAIREAGVALREVAALSQELRAEVPPLARDARGLIQDARGTLAPLKGSLQHAQRALGRAEESLGKFNRLLDRNTHVGDTLDDTLRELQAAARALRELANTLEQQPEALLRGKREETP
jgi:paraquat-inducible protein B